MQKARFLMDKNNKWYKSIQILFDVAKKYGDTPVKTEEDLGKIYYAVKEQATKESKFVQELLLAFVNEKRREMEGESDAEQTV